MNKRKPKSWSEWWNAHKKHYYVTTSSQEHPIPLGSTRKKAKAEVCRIKEFERLLALRNEWVGDWTEKESRYCFAPAIINAHKEPYLDAVRIIYGMRISRLTFPTEEMCAEFIKCFGPKIKKVLL